MKNCKNCYWWKKHEGFHFMYGEEKEFGQCEYVSVRETDTPFWIDSITKIGVVKLMTLADFVCAAWEEHDPGKYVLRKASPRD